LHHERLEHSALDDLAAGGVDRVGDVGVELDPAVGVAGRPVLVELAATLVAEASPQGVLRATTGAAVGELPVGHGHRRAPGALDDLQVPDHKGVVEGHRAERLEALVLVAVIHELDPDFGDDHSCSPYFLWHTQSQLRTTCTGGSPGGVAPPSASSPGAPAP